MKHHPTLPTKREPVRKGLMKRLHAVTRKRKQHQAATAMAGDFESELPGRKIGMALAVIVGVHVVAAGLVFFHHWRLEGRGGDASTASASKPAPVLLASGGAANLPQISPDDQMYAVRSGDTYEKIAAKQEVDVADLRAANNEAPIQAGRILKIPPKRIVAMPPPEVAAIREAEPPADRGNIPPKAIIESETATLVHPSKNTREKAESFRAVERNADREPRPSTTSKASTSNKATTAKTTTPSKATASNVPKAKPVKESDTPKTKGKRSYTVKSGDNLLQIASRTNSDQKAIMKANGITDARKLKIGTTLVIPN